MPTPSQRLCSVCTRNSLPTRSSSFPNCLGCSYGTNPLTLGWTPTNPKTTNKTTNPTSTLSLHLPKLTGNIPNDSTYNPRPESNTPLHLPRTHTPMKRKPPKTTEATTLVLNPLSTFTFNRSGRYLIALGDIIPPPCSTVYHPDQQEEVNTTGGLWEALYDAESPCSIRIASNPKELTPISNVTAWAFLGTSRKPE